VGKKARDYFTRRSYSIKGEMIGVAAAPTSADATRIAAGAIERFIAGDLDEVVVVYNEFVSAMVQRPRIERVLPLSVPREEGSAQVLLEPIFEPSRDEMLAVLLPRVVENRIYHALLESAAAEHAARMTAMEAATSNASEMIESLTLQFNKARQAAITKELMEIVGGAEALASA
jgi:F-type H+-transporting ATPase subunit gamma